MKIFCYNGIALKKSDIYRGVEQLVARRAHNPEVVGSSPTPATTNGKDTDRCLFYSYLGLEPTTSTPTFTKHN